MSDSTAGSHGRTNVITAARPSYDEQFRTRRKRYVIMMAMRLPCLIAAAVLYRIPWLAILIILVSIPLPWCAVLIANDGPARTRVKARRGVINDQRALPGPTREIVDAPADRGAADRGGTDRGAADRDGMSDRDAAADRDAADPDGRAGRYGSAGEPTADRGPRPAP